MATKNQVQRVLRRANAMSIKEKPEDVVFKQYYIGHLPKYQRTLMRRVFRKRDEKTAKTLRLNLNIQEDKDFIHGLLRNLLEENPKTTTILADYNWYEHFKDSVTYVFEHPLNIDQSYFDLIERRAIGQEGIPLLIFIGFNNDRIGLNLLALELNKGIVHGKRCSPISVLIIDLKELPTY